MGWQQSQSTARIANLISLRCYTLSSNRLNGDLFVVLVCNKVAFYSVHVCTTSYLLCIMWQIHGKFITIHGRIIPDLLYDRCRDGSWIKVLQGWMIDSSQFLWYNACVRFEILCFCANENFTYCSYKHVKCILWSKNNIEFIPLSILWDCRHYKAFIHLICHCKSFASL